MCVCVYGPYVRTYIYIYIYGAYTIIIFTSFKPVVKEHAAEALGRSLAIFNQYELVDSTRLDDL